jgi:hypothetical protein
LPRSTVVKRRHEERGGHEEQHFWIGAAERALIQSIFFGFFVAFVFSFTAIVSG